MVLQRWSDTDLGSGLEVWSEGRAKENEGEAYGGRALQPASYLYKQNITE